MKLMAIILTIPKLGPSQLLNTVDWQTAAKNKYFGTRNKYDLRMLAVVWKSY